MGVIRILLVSFIMCLIGGGRWGVALASPAKIKKIERSLKILKVKGRILNAKEVQFQGSDKKHLVVLLKTKKGHQELIVDLGDLKKMQGIEKGKTKIKVEGSMVRVGEKEFMLAREIQYGDEVIIINRKNYHRARTQ